MSQYTNVPMHQNKDLLSICYVSETFYCEYSIKNLFGIITLNCRTQSLSSQIIQLFTDFPPTEGKQVKCNLAYNVKQKYYCNGCIIPIDSCTYFHILENPFLSQVPIHLGQKTYSLDTYIHCFYQNIYLEIQ